VKRVTPTLVIRLAAIGVILLAVTAGFAFAAGWLSPDRLSPRDIVDSLQIHDGLHPGFRRAHAKGLCIEGRFLANGNGTALSKAGVFTPGDVPVIGRLSTGGGLPYAPDGRLVFHAIALSLTQANGEQWRMAMDDTPIFFVATPQAFRDFQLATAPDPETGKPDPVRTADFLAHHPETRAFMEWMRDAPLPSSFANGTYYSINAFRFTNAAGETRFVRWSLVPETPFTALDKSTLASVPPNFLFDDVVQRLRQGPLRWHMVVTVAAPGDPVDGRRRHQALAVRPPAGRCRHAYNRSRHDRRGRRLPQYHVRPLDPAGRHGVLGRPAAGCALGRICRLPDAAGRRAGGAECRFKRPRNPQGRAMKAAVAQFPLALRLVHWLMAAMVVAMLFIGVGMVSTVSEMRTWLIDLHKPLGILILCLAALRVCLRLMRPAPPLPDDLPIWQKAAAYASHLVLYALMFALPLVGWTMLSAGGYPIALFGSIHLPPLGPVDPTLFSLLRRAHTLLALLLFLTILAHLGAALFHAWIRRDGVFRSMVPWR
jgi:catalase